MKRLLIGLAFAALAMPANALAGGWATAGVGPPDDGIGAGDTWNAKVTILQHGNPDTPLMGVVPTLTIKNGSTTKTFKGTKTDEAGVSVVKVVFPSSGKWSYAVYDGFTEYGGAQMHTFGAISVDPASGGSGFDLPSLPIMAGILLALGAAIALVLGMRRIRPRPAPQL